MKSFIRNFFSKKRNILLVVIILLLFLAIANHTINGVVNNIQLMSAPNAVELYLPPYPQTNTEGKDAELIKRGEYLARAGDCIACHTNTPDKGKSFAGGLPMLTPFGTIYTPNITPDKETGIGNWTEEQFIRAMREGISASGHYYYPAFPYPYFNRVSTDDLKALKAYLDSIPAIHQPNRENEMIFPFNWRFMQLGWRILFFHPKGPYQADTTKSEEWNRGAYLIEGLGHCGMCHTPSYYLLSEKVPLGAPITKYHLTGAKVQGYLAPNITKSNLGAIPLKDIDEVFVHNKLIGGGTVEGPMLEVNMDSLTHLTPEDRSAMATYLKTVDSEIPPRPRGVSVGESVYANYCSGCHASGAGGAPVYGDPNAWEPVAQKGMTVVYQNALQGIGGMPAKGTCLTCSDDDVKKAVDYMLNAVKGKKAQKRPPKLKKLTIADGKRIYDANCSVCHESHFKGAPKPGDQAAWKPIVADGFLNALLNVEKGRKGHPVRGACPNCTDAELIAAVKYMMQTSAPNENYDLW